jgi:hypothetical protein
VTGIVEANTKRNGLKSSQRNARHDICAASKAYWHPESRIRNPECSKRKEKPTEKDDFDGKPRGIWKS